MHSKQILSQVFLIFASLIGAMDLSRAQVERSLKGVWEFSATAQTPSSTIDGTLDIVFDSATIVVGGFRTKLENGTASKARPFHGRHIGDRFIAKTDSGFFPIVRIDLTQDSTHAFNGSMQVSKVTGLEHRRHAGSVEREYRDVIYSTYMLRGSSDLLKPKSTKKLRRKKS